MIFFKIEGFVGKNSVDTRTHLNWIRTKSAKSFAIRNAYRRRIHRRRNMHGRGFIGNK